MAGADAVARVSVILPAYRSEATVAGWPLSTAPPDLHGLRDRAGRLGPKLRNRGRRGPRLPRGVISLGGETTVYLTAPFRRQPART